jgi:membrane protease YdiL (CAAX protease family)
LLLGAARIKTGSTLTTLAMHAAGNAIATIEVAIHTAKSLP